MSTEEQRARTKEREESNQWRVACRNAEFELERMRVQRSVFAALAFGFLCSTVLGWWLLVAGTP